jgi:hypothetical protein
MKPNLQHKDRTCESTKNAHVASSLDIAGDEERQFTYWLLVFPGTIVLDNVRHGPTGGEPSIGVAVTNSKLTNMTL